MTQFIMMTEEAWKNSMLSTARHFGGINFNGQTYTIVNKEGVDVITLSHIASKEGREHAIEPGEPCDLVRDTFLPHYRRLGRDKFVQILKNNNDKTDKEIQEIFKHTEK